MPFGHWDSRRKGLLAGEGLLLELSRLEKSALDQDSRYLEIEKNIALLDEAVAHNRAVADAGFAIVRLTPEDVSELTPERVRELSGFTDYNLVRLQLGAATAFIEGGFLAVLPDRALRAEIAGLPRLQEEIDEEMMAVNMAQGGRDPASGVRWKLPGIT